MDRKRDYHCRIAADVLFAARYGVSSCTVIYAAPSVWVADRHGIGCHYLHFYTDCSLACYFGSIFSDYHAERQRIFAYWCLPVAKCCLIFCRAFGLEKENFIEGQP